MEFPGLITLIVIFAAGYLAGRRHAGAGTRSDPDARRRWKMRADNNVVRRADRRFEREERRPAGRADARTLSPGAGTSTGRKRGGFGGFMDAMNIETLAASMPAATQSLIREGDRKGAARSLAAAYPTMAPHVVEEAVNTWAVRNGA